MCHCLKYARTVQQIIELASRVTVKDVAMMADAVQLSSLNLLILASVSGAVSLSYVFSVISIWVGMSFSIITYVFEWLNIHSLLCDL